MKPILLLLLLTAPAQAQNLDRLYTAVDAERAFAGVPLLVVDSRLEAAAKAHAKWCVENRSTDHYSYGLSPYQQALLEGYDGFILVREDGQTAELVHNIIVRHKGNPDKAVNYWVRSDGHYTALIAPQWRDMGAASVAGWNGQRVTVLFLGVEQ